MESCTQDQRHANLHAPELNVRTALRGVVQQVAAGCGRNNCSRLLSKAWAILLDLDAADTSEVGKEHSSSRMVQPYLHPAMWYGRARIGGTSIEFVAGFVIVTIFLQVLQDVPDREQHNRIAAAQVRWTWLQRCCSMHVTHLHATRCTIAFFQSSDGYKT